MAKIRIHGERHSYRVLSALQQRESARLLIVFGIEIPDGGDPLGLEPFAHDYDSIAPNAADWLDKAAEDLTRADICEFVDTPSCFSPWLEEYQPLFAPLEEFQRTQMALPGDSDADWALWLRRRDELLIQCLRDLDEKGLFGTGAARRDLCLFLRPACHVSAPAAVFLDIVSSLNPDWQGGERMRDLSTGDEEIVPLTPFCGSYHCAFTVCADDGRRVIWDTCFEVFISDLSQPGKKGKKITPKEPYPGRRWIPSAAWFGDLILLTWRDEKKRDHLGVSIIDPANGTEQRIHETSKQIVDVAACAGTGHLAIREVANDYNREVRVSVWRDGKILFQRDFPNSIGGMQFWDYQGDRHLVVPGGGLQVIRLSDGQAETLIEDCGHFARLPGNSVVVARADSWRIRDLESGKIEQEITVDPTGDLAERLASGWKPYFGFIDAVAASRDGSQVAVGFGSCEGCAEVCVYSRNSGTEIARLNYRHDRIVNLWFTDNDHDLVVAGHHASGSPFYLWKR